MRKNISPWLYQLRKDRASEPLAHDIQTDVVIVGAGIAGIATAFFTLKNTNKKVVVVDRFKLAHGATGHNAGQVTTYFERGFASIADEFGLALAADGQRSIENAWSLMDEMYTDASLDIPFSRFLGHAGLSSFEQVMVHLANNLARKRADLQTERILISGEADFVSKIPGEFTELYSLVSKEEIQTILEVTRDEYVAVISYQKGCINSALFCEEIVLYLQKQYPDRFALFEHTPVTKIILRNGHALLDTNTNTIEASHIVLCTNGFNSVTIFDEHGLGIDTKFHHLLHGTVGYMSGYLEKMNKPPIAISYFTDPDPSADDPYFYLTRRTYEYEGDGTHNLISVGGPEQKLEDSVLYSSDNEYPDDMSAIIDVFVRNTYETDPNKKIDYVFTWHGLMGYTRNGVRLIGPEPKNPVLIYNLGCNGVGILPSVYGGKRISLFLSGKPLEKSIFDIPEKA